MLSLVLVSVKLLALLIFIERSRVEQEKDKIIIKQGVYK